MNNNVTLAFVLTLRQNRPHSEMLDINITDKLTISQFEQIEQQCPN